MMDARDATGGRVPPRRRRCAWALAALALAAAVLLATTQAAHTAPTKARPTYGDPAFKPNKRDQATVANFIKIYGQRMGMGRALRYKIVAGISANATGNADALVVTATGGTGADAGFCRIRVLPSMSGDPVFRKLVLAHEAFHCWQADIMGGTHNTPYWVIEGGADWAALSVDPVSFSVGGGNLKTYFSTPEKPLFTRSYDAVGFWAQLNTQTGDLFARWPEILRAAVGGDQAAYDATGAEQPQVLDTWAASALDIPRIGPNWTLRQPVMAAPNLAPRAQVLTPSDTAVKAQPYTVSHYEIDNVNYPDTEPLIHIQVNGHGRLGNTAARDLLAQRYLVLPAGHLRMPAQHGGQPAAGGSAGRTRVVSRDHGRAPGQRRIGHRRVARRLLPPEAEKAADARTGAAHRRRRGRGLLSGRRTGVRGGVRRLQRRPASDDLRWALLRLPGGR